jgi:hypothetical protein
MPPAAIIPEATKRRLEIAYAPTQSLETESHGSTRCLEHFTRMLPERPSPSPAPNTHAVRQDGRSLPARAVTDDNIDDAYVDFIMYCNPTVALDTDTTELRKTFRSPPKSDGKSFSPFILFQLIQKLEQKQLKTWAQLVLELGVEAPSVEKGNSAQKVQQYAVRLKVSSVFTSLLMLKSTPIDLYCELVPSFLNILPRRLQLNMISGGYTLCMLTLSSSIS